MFVGVFLECDAEIDTVWSKLLEKVKLNVPLPVGDPVGLERVMRCVVIVRESLPNVMVSLIDSVKVCVTVLSGDWDLEDEPLSVEVRDKERERADNDMSAELEKLSEDEKVEVAVPVLVRANADLVTEADRASVKVEEALSEVVRVALDVNVPDRHVVGDVVGEPVKESEGVSERAAVSEAELEGVSDLKDSVTWGEKLSVRETVQDRVKEIVSLREAEGFAEAVDESDRVDVKVGDSPVTVTSCVRVMLGECVAVADRMVERVAVTEPDAVVEAVAGHDGERVAVRGQVSDSEGPDSDAVNDEVLD